MEPALNTTPNSIVAGSAEVVKKPIKKTRDRGDPRRLQRSAIVRNRSLQRQVKDLGLAANAIDLQKQLAQTANLNQPPKKKLGVDDAVKEISRKARLTAVNIASSFILIAAYAVQLVGWLIYFAAEYIKTYWIIQQVDTYVIDLDWIKYVGWAVGTVAGLFALGWMAGAYSAAFINWWRGFSIWIFIFCAALYFVPHLLVVPWIVLWMTYIFWSHSR